MSCSIVSDDGVQRLLDRAVGLDNEDGNARIKAILRRILGDLYATIEAFDVSPSEFWTAVEYITRLGQSNEGGLLVAGLGVEHFLDLLLDEKERRTGLSGGTPRTIEGPLWLADAPLEHGSARLDQDPEEDAEAIVMRGRVMDVAGRPIPGAIVDVWHANTKGGYSHFDPSQSAWNLRRRIAADADGRYEFRSIMPAGYGCPPDGATQELLTRLGRHGQRPAHIHFFVEAPGYRKLTTQINLAGDAYLHDDFAFATRDELIVAPRRETSRAEHERRGLDGPHATLEFDFMLHGQSADLPDTVVVRRHAGSD